MEKRFSISRLLRYHRIVNSIAFLPAVITLLFLAAAIVMVIFDFSAAGKEVKASFQWFSLKDATTARSIISSIVSGIISLAVFSFSLVMIILNQTASQMSNRILDNLIGNKFQQSVLGVYSGTIVFALFLLSTIRDTDTGVSVPALSTYLLIALTVVDLFLFIYFLHYITQSVKYETIIRRIADHTMTAMKKRCDQPIESLEKPATGVPVEAPKDGIFQGFQQEALLNLCNEKKIIVSFIYSYGTYLIKGTPYLIVTGAENEDEEFRKHLNSTLHIEKEMTIDSNYYYGFQQLMEVALKALSPGINDPGTAVSSLQAISSLLAYRINHHPQLAFAGEDGIPKIFSKEKSFEEVFESIILPIWDYGKNDRIIQQALHQLLEQLILRKPYKCISNLLYVVERAKLKKVAMNDN